MRAGIAVAGNTEEGEVHWAVTCFQAFSVRFLLYVGNVLLFCVFILF